MGCQIPQLDIAIDEALLEFITKRAASMDDARYRVGTLISKTGDGRWKPLRIGDRLPGSRVTSFAESFGYCSTNDCLQQFQLGVIMIDNRCRSNA